MKKVLRVLSLYPDQMNIYADRGNLLFLRNRTRWRGLDFALETCGPGESFDPGSHDLIYIGGGQDRDQIQVAEDMLSTKRAALDEAIETDAVVLAVCGGYQLLGRTWATQDQVHSGLGLIDMETVRPDEPRLIGAVAIELELSGQRQMIAGFENHGGRTWLGEDVKPWGEVARGHGNNGKDGHEGVRHRNLIGTYLHGPLLPKNHRLADDLIARALSRAEGEPVGLEPLDDTYEEAAHAEALAAALTAR